MQIFVESVTKRTISDRVNIPTFNKGVRHIGGGVAQEAEIIVKVEASTEEEIAAWEAAVGKVLDCKPPSDG